MTKRKLLELLEKVKDHEQVYFHNGFVDDYMDIGSLQTVELIQEKKGWEYPNPYVTPEEMELFYGVKRKKVYIINPKMRNKIFADRIGRMEY